MNNEIEIATKARMSLIELDNTLFNCGYKIVPIKKLDSVTENMNSSLLDLSYKYHKQLKTAQKKIKKLENKLKRKDKVIDEAIDYIENRKFKDRNYPLKDILEILERGKNGK